MRRETLAKDQLRCWGLMDRWRKVTDRPVPAHWSVHGEPPTDPARIVGVCMDAYFSPGMVDRVFTTSFNPLYAYLQGRR